MEYWNFTHAHILELVRPKYILQKYPFKCVSILLQMADFKTFTEKIIENLLRYQGKTNTKLNRLNFSSFYNFWNTLN